MEGRFTLVQPETEFILMDTCKGFYARLQQKGIQPCKMINSKDLICNQDFPLFPSHSTTDCEALILQPI